MGGQGTLTFDLIIPQGTRTYDLGIFETNEDGVLVCNQMNGEVSYFERNATITLPPLDHFLCYDAVLDKKSKFKQRNVTLDDQFEERTFLVKKPERLCNPVDKNDEGIADPDTHLVAYTLRPDDVIIDQTVAISNQFHSEGNELVVQVLGTDGCWRRARRA